MLRQTSQLDICVFESLHLETKFFIIAFGLLFFFQYSDGIKLHRSIQNIETYWYKLSFDYQCTAVPLGFH